jgi:hypothetical protein
MHHGRCLCGDVRFTAEAELPQLTHCHCSRCRKAHGTPFVTWGFVAKDGFRATGGEHVVRYQSSSEYARSFCGRCGSTVPGNTLGDWMEIPAGSLTTEPQARPVEHIFVGSKASWFEITDDLPRHDAYPPGFGAPTVPELARADSSGGAHGSCLCGGVRFEMRGTPITARYCHCSRCRLARAAAFACNVGAAHDDVVITDGRDRIASYKLPDAQFFTQSFCRTCGGKVPFHDASRGIAVAPLGAFDTDPPMLPVSHIFVGSKAPWFEITDDLPQMTEGLPIR